MKNFYFLTILALILVAGCQPKAETESVDLNAINDTVNQLVDMYQDAWNNKDIDVFIALVSDDGLFFGSDPSEQMDKAGLIKMYSELFADTTDFSYTSMMRKIKLSDDGKSAFVIEHISLAGWSPLIQMRQTFSFVNTDDNWIIDYLSWAFIARNEDMQKLNKALE